MTNETRQRIEQYKQLLPAMKEKIFASVVMLLVAVVTVTSATYAWMTLSVSPEATSIDTTIVANGALEIALADGTGSTPGKSAAGDSTGAGNSVTSANITWGNLVNLSDPSYGLSNITLRPAALKGTYGLLTNPLYGVGYGEDGRVSSMVTDDDFAYVYYDTDTSKFLVDMTDTHLGVRAISTVQYENLEGDSTLQELLRYANENWTLARNNYRMMTEESEEPGKSYIASLEGLIQIYAQNVLDKKSTSTLDITEYVPNLYNMMLYFYDNVMIPTGESYVQMANMLELMIGSGNSDAGYTVATLVAAYRNNSMPEYIKNNIGSFGTFASDYTTLTTYLTTSPKGDYSDLDQNQKNNSLAYWAYYAQNGGTVYWSNLNGIINWICDINTATLDTYTLSALSSVGTAMSVIRNGNPHDAVIHGGAIQRMEKRIGGYPMSPTISVTVDASSISPLIGKITMDAILTTSAEEPYELDEDINAVKALNTGSFRGDTATAQDTYALAVDLWLRTNAGADDTVTDTIVTGEDGTVTTTSPERAYLTLEGKVVTAMQEAAATIKDANGDEQPAYKATFTLEGQEYNMTVFERYGSYYFIDDSGEEVNFEDWITDDSGTRPDVTYTPQMTSREVVIGYEGENRVWNEEQMAGYVGEGTSATQGGGSCYVFYADTPADQSRFLELLRSMRVVFINAQGKQIGAATMDTANYYAENGRVTVPLVLDQSKAINLGTDSDGNTIYGLMAMKKNAATRVTALIYLDGTKLTNEMVLASGDIQGSLNLQFGNYMASKVTTTTTDEEGVTDTNEHYQQGEDSIAIENEPVMDEKIAVSASVTNTSFEYDPDHAASTTLNVKVEGLTPGTVGARFIRAISSTQGVQQEMENLAGSGENWSKEITFARPGNYVLRTVWVDGVEYTLAAPVTVTVTGSAVNSLSCDALPEGSNRATIMTADSFFSTNMTLGFTSSAQVPSRVNGIFMDKNGRQVNVPFNLKAGVWTGTASFSTSGTFTMEYVEIDGDIYELNTALQPTLEILLGLKVSTSISASPETLAKLQQINENALPTRFVLDTGAKDADGNKILDVAGKKDVTLLVTSKIYDNSGNEINGLSGVKLYYGRVGSTVQSRGLDSNLTWNVAEKAYTGSFLITEAGTFSFSKVTVDTGGKTSTITTKTSAPNIQAMPPDDAYYFNNYTDTYQYKPNKNAAMTIGVAYSSAASKIEATITDGTNVQTVEGVMGLEADDQGGKSVNLWSFKIPEINGSQEGEWQLKDITMYGVYFNKQYYDSENGVKVDLSGENIHTKVVNYIYVTLSGTSHTGAEAFSGYFMDDHKVSDLTVEIADYEGDAIQGYTINDVKVVYYLNGSKVSLDTYDYTSDNLSTVLVSGEGSLEPGSDTLYQISEMNFQQAGPYETCEVSFAMDRTSVSADTDGTNGAYIQYRVNGTNSDKCPQYEVKWTRPDVVFTATNPAVGTTFNAGQGRGSSVTAVSVSNKIENNGHECTVYIKYEKSCGMPSYTVSKVTAELRNAGDNFTGAEIIFPNANNEAKPVTYTFSPSKLSNQQDVGYVNGFTRNVIGTQSKTTMEFVYNEITYTISLKEKVTLINTY